MSVNFIDYIQCQWTCPITQLPIKDPAITQDGHSYERVAIIQWLYQSSKSPQTGLTLQSKKIIPNRALKAVISKFTNFCHQLEANYKKDFALLQQIIEGQIKEKQIIANQILHFKQQPFLTQTSQSIDENLSKQKIPPNLEKKLSQIIEGVQISEFNLIEKYLQLTHSLLNESTKQALSVRLNEISQKYQLKQKSFHNKSIQNEFFKNPSFSKGKRISILDSPLLISFEKNQSIIELIKLDQSLNHPFEYLLETFKSEKQIKARYQKNEFTQLCTFEHQRVPLEMKKFVQYDWKQLKTINLMDCCLKDQDWRLFVINASKFPNLRQIKLYENKVREVREGDLQSFKELSSISFYRYGGWTNPLSEQSKSCLRKFKQTHPEVHVLFQQ